MSAIYIDPVDFGAPAAVESPVDFLASNEIATYVVKRGQALNEALRSPVNSAAPALLTSAGAQSDLETSNDSR